MNRTLQRVVRFVRWLFAAEPLPEAPSPGPRPRRVAGLVLAADALPADPVGGRCLRRPGFLATVLQPETLPSPDAPVADAPARTKLLRWLAAPDTCPVDGAPTAPRRSGLLAALLGPSELPRVSAPAPRRRTGFLRWLLSSDEL